MPFAQCPKFGVRAFVRQWFRFLEKCFGRGVVQLIAATFPLCDGEVPGAVLGIMMFCVGGMNMLYGWRAGKTLNKCMAQLQGETQGVNDPQMQIKLMHKKFEALDMNGNGQLTRDELIFAAEEVKLPMTRWEVDAAFDTLAGYKDYLDLDDFARWWFRRNRDATADAEDLLPVGQDFSVV
eukprot:GHVN01081062.1.p2 GENE.GHVN01081062.1~~GHVN01081062.1.p2  ORF type:complete len:180 (-),score=29.35 GHVN01081062.1:833-1372(-)